MAGVGELRLDIAKVEAIKNWPILRSTIETRSFVGATQYVCNFILDFSSIVLSLHSIVVLCKNFHWSRAYDDVFVTLKNKICNALVLCLTKI